MGSFGKPYIRLQNNKLTVETPYNQSWVTAIKLCVPGSRREWVQHQGIWLFDTRYYDCVRTITECMFGSGVIDAVGQKLEHQDVAWWDKWKAYQDGYTPPTPKASKGGPYDVLFVKSDAPMIVIQAAYRALANKYHPDKGGDEAKMQELTNAMDQIRKSRA